jgi:AcrR family transcriptional regulator
MANPKQDATGKDALLECARRLFLNNGYASVSMQQIAEAAGMTKGAPYYHFKNKDELFLHVFLNEINRQKEGFIAALQVPGTIEERLVHALAFVFRSTAVDLFTLFADAKRHLDPASFASHESEPEQGKRDDIDAILVPFFVEMAGQGVRLRVSAERASHLFTLLMMGQLHTLHGDHRRLPETGTPEEMAAELVDVFLHGVL